MERIENPPFMRKAHSEALRSVLGSPVRSSHRGFAERSRLPLHRGAGFSACLQAEKTEGLYPPTGYGVYTAFPCAPVQISHRGFAERSRLPLHRGAEVRSPSERCGVCTGEPRLALRRWVRVLQRGREAHAVWLGVVKGCEPLWGGAVLKSGIFLKKTKPFSELLLRKGLNRITDYQYLSTTSKSQMSR